MSFFFWNKPKLFSFLQHSVVYYEQDGDEIYPLKPQGDVVTIPDPEVLQVIIILLLTHRLGDDSILDTQVQ